MSTPVVTLADVLSNPDAALRRAREVGPAVPADVGVLVVGYEAVRTLLSDRRLRNSFTDALHLFGITSGPFHEWMRLSPLEMDGEPHRRWRQLMARAFTPQSVHKLRPFIRAESERLVGAFVDQGSCDFIDAFARRLPSAGLCELIGVPAEDRDMFCGWADTIGLGFNFVLAASRIEEIDSALSALLDYAKGLVERRRRDPRDDLVTRIAQASDEDGGLEEAQIWGSVAGLVFAGHETTKNQLGWMISVLSAAPEEWDRAAREPERVRAIVEEVFRFRSAATSVGRIAKEDLEVEGCPVSAGTRVVASLWGANRCPDAFPDPDRFDVDAHQGNPQLAFGHGAHHCIGSALARAELQEALIALSTAITCPRVGEGAVWLPPLGITGATTLPITFEKRTR
jgi:cytochrome P450